MGCSFPSSSCLIGIQFWMIEYYLWCLNTTWEPKGPETHQGHRFYTKMRYWMGHVTNMWLILKYSGIIGPIYHYSVKTFFFSRLGQAFKHHNWVNFLSFAFWNIFAFWHCFRFSVCNPIFLIHVPLQTKAQLVVIAHDVDPIELVVWLPALCRKMEIPYCIVKGKARLGAVYALCFVLVISNLHLDFLMKWYW